MKEAIFTMLSVEVLAVEFTRFQNSIMLGKLVWHLSFTPFGQQLKCQSAN